MGNTIVGKSSGGEKKKKKNSEKKKRKGVKEYRIERKKNAK